MPPLGKNTRFDASMKELYFTFSGHARKAITPVFLVDDIESASTAVELLNRHRLVGTFFVSHDAAGNLADLFSGHEVALLPTDNANARKKRAVLEKRLNRPVFGRYSCTDSATNDETPTPVGEDGFAYALLPSFGNHECKFPQRDLVKWNPLASIQSVSGAVLDAYENDSWGGTVRAMILTAYTSELQKNAASIEAKLERMSRVRGCAHLPLAALQAQFLAFQSLRTTTDRSIVENLSACELTANYGNDHGAALDTIQVSIRPGNRLRLPTETLLSPPPSPDGLDVLELKEKQVFRPTFPNHLRKAITFSYDDGAPEDDPLLEILNRHRFKGSFNLNTDRFPKQPVTGQLSLQDLPKRYAGHEVTVHGCGHETWNAVTPAAVLEDVLRCRKELESVFHRPIVGSAYPCGEHSKSKIVDAILTACGIVYDRIINNDDLFSLPIDFLAWGATSHHNGRDGMSLCELGQKFLDEKPVFPILFYVWGHSFEFPRRNNWNVMEEFCSLLEPHPEIWRATNLELHDYIRAVRNLFWYKDSPLPLNRDNRPLYGFGEHVSKCSDPFSVGFTGTRDGTCLVNPSALPVYGFLDDRPIVLRPVDPISILHLNLV